MVLYCLAIAYKVSPDFTVYVPVVGVIDEEVPPFDSKLGILNCCPILNVLLVRLFKFFIASTVVLYFFAMLHKLSPDLTV